jgi:integrase
VKLIAIYEQEEREQYGLVVPRSLRESSIKPLHSHLAEYLANLRALGRTAKHVHDTETRITRVFVSLGWEYLRDVSADAFMTWRSRQRKLAAKTLHEYQVACTAFFSWLEKCGRSLGNPLRFVQRVETRGREKIHRRALLLEELRRLVSINRGHRGLVYFFAAYTGLRRSEIASLRWSDLNLEGKTPFVLVRASTAKNRKSAAIPLHPELVASLRFYQQSQKTLSGPVFPSMPTDKTFNGDLMRCGIEKHDCDGRKIDFHALRVTFATLLNLQGVAPRSAMELMRHSDMRLTHKVYTDVSALPLVEDVGKLPWVVSAADKKGL